MRARQVEVGEDDDGQRLDNFLLRELKGIPRSAVYRLLRTGQVRVNGGRAKPDRRLEGGDTVRIPPVRIEETPTKGSPSAAQRATVVDAILHEDRDLLVLNKPAGMAVHGGSGISFGVIEVLRAARPDATLELAHRLDRETSGCLIVSKRRPALRKLHAAFRDGTVEKRYLALVVGRWTQGTVTVNAALRRNQVQGGERIVKVDEAGGKAASSRFRPVATYEVTDMGSESGNDSDPMSVTLVEVIIDTGRTHQIRVHAAHLGHPVAGDDKYGEETANKRLRTVGLKRMFLHASALSLPHPNGEPLAVSAPLDDELRAVLDALEAGNG